MIFSLYVELYYRNKCTQMIAKFFARVQLHLKHSLALYRFVCLSRCASYDLLCPCGTVFSRYNPVSPLHTLCLMNSAENANLPRPRRYIHNNRTPNNITTITNDDEEDDDDDVDDQPNAIVQDSAHAHTSHTQRKRDEANTRKKERHQQMYTHIQYSAVQDELLLGFLCCYSCRTNMF